MMNRNDNKRIFLQFFSKMNEYKYQFLKIDDESAILNKDWKLAAILVLYRIACHICNRYPKIIQKRRTSWSHLAGKY